MNNEVNNNGSWELRPLGNTGIQVTPLCYGCASAYARDLISDDTAVELFKKAYDLGIRFFDTAINYGKAEDRIGLSLKKHNIDRDEIVISTKGGKKFVDGKWMQDINPKSIKENVDTSLKRMGIDYIDVLYLHGSGIQDLTDDVLECFAELKQAGKIRACGANTFDDDVINYIIKTKCLDVVMLDYNVVKQNREPQIKALYDNGIGVVAGQALAEGLFLSDLFKIRGKKDLWYLARTLGRKASRELFFEARKLSFMNRLKGYDGSQVALKYVIDNPYVASAAVGTCSFDHLQKNVDALAVDIPEDIKERIRKAAAK
ncbi:MAG: aldo/keto reductase [Clostridia bacterium]|nr:aldo/keto reductase [Clostridia bacterium]